MIATQPARECAPELSVQAAPVHWQIVTGEYPPQPGGVSDYSRLLAHALADAGDSVTVWAPACRQPDESYPRVSVRRLADRFGPGSLRWLDRALDALPEPRRLLVQYVPHAFGWKAANLPFCFWLRSRRRDSVWIMFHEVAYPHGTAYSLAENVLALVTRWMAAIAGRHAERIFVSIPGWRPIVESAVGKSVPLEWLPVPSSVPVADDAAGVASVRSRMAHGHPLVGHLGTYGRLIRPMLRSTLPVLLAATDCRVLLLGRGGDGFRDELTAAYPELAGRIDAPGPLSPDDLSRHVSACDLMLQPYPDGVSSRRTTVMVALAHGRPVVTTFGDLSEPLWSGGDVVLAAVDRPDELAAAAASLIADPARLRDLAARARALYAERFDVRHTVAILRSASAPARRQ
jgi:glycosyltransferase involved in cell wall biosynthesis